jgi:hypothetical protein
MNDHDFAGMPQAPSQLSVLPTRPEWNSHSVAIGDWDLTLEETETAERHIRSIAAGLSQRCAQVGFDPAGYELAYWLHDGGATNNANAIQRWVRRMLDQAPDLPFTDKIDFTENRLQTILEETR